MAVPTVDEAVGGYLQYLESMNYKDSTVMNSAAVLRALVRHTGTRRLNTVNPTTITEFMIVQSKTRKGRSLVLSHDRLAVFFKWCVTNGYIRPQHNPMNGRRPPKFDAHERFRLHFSKFPLMLDVAEKQEPRDRAVCAAAIYTLLRDQELATLKVRDVQLDAGYIGAVIHKSRKEDLVPVCAELDTELRRWLVHYAAVMGRPLDPNWYLFPFLLREQQRDQGRIAKSSIVGYVPEKLPGALGRFIRPVLEDIGVPMVDENGKSTHEGAHTLRRSGARGLYDVLSSRGRADALRILQTMLHHKDVTVTQDYIGLDPDKVTRDMLIRGEVIYGFDALSKIGAGHEGEANGDEVRSLRQG